MNKKYDYFKLFDIKSNLILRSIIIRQHLLWVTCLREARMNLMMYYIR